MFDIGATYFNDAYQSIAAGTPPIGYGLNIDQATDDWQKVLNDDPNGQIHNFVDDAIQGAKSMRAAIAGGTNGETLNLSAQAVEIRNAYSDVSDACKTVHYNMTQPLPAPQ